MFIKHGLTLTDVLELGELKFVAAVGGTNAMGGTTENAKCMETAS